MILVTCIKCNWVSIAVTKEFARAAIKQYNTWRKTAPKEHKKYTRNSSLKDYACMLCGNNAPESFRKAVEGDCPIDYTINPVISYLATTEEVIKPKRSKL